MAHINQIPGNFEVKHSDETIALHREYMTSLFGNPFDPKITKEEVKAIADKGKAVYLDIAFAMSPRLFTEDIRVYYGHGMNGKSGLLKLIQFVVGDHNTTAVTPRELEKDPHAASNLLHKTLNVAGDVDSTYTDKVDTIKRLTAGDTMMANFKGKQAFSFKPYAYCMFSVNDIPQGKDGDSSEGLARRLKFLNFDKIVDKDVFFKTKYFTKEHAEYLIFKAIIALQEFQRGDLKVYGDEKLLEEGKMDTDVFYRFIKEYTPKINESPYETYTSWVQDEGLKPMSRYRFMRRLEKN